MRFFKHKNTLKLGGRSNSQLYSSKWRNFLQPKRHAGTLNQSPAPSSRTNSLMSFLERKSIHWSISGQLSKAGIVRWDLWIGPWWRKSFRYKFYEPFLITNSVITKIHTTLFEHKLCDWSPIVPPFTRQIASRHSISNWQTH